MPTIAYHYKRMMTLAWPVHAARTSTERKRMIGCPIVVIRRALSPRRDKELPIKVRVDRGWQTQIASISQIVHTANRRRPIMNGKDTVHGNVGMR